jgi:hypothetical protein
MLTLLQILAAGPQSNQDTVCTLDLTSLSPSAAHDQDGQRALYRITLDSLPGDAGTHTVHDCVSPDAVNRTVWLVPGQPCGSETTFLTIVLIP